MCKFVNFFANNVKCTHFTSKGGMCPALVISMKSEASIILHCQLITQQYCSKSPSVIKVATVKNTDNFCYAKKAIMCYRQINTFYCQQRCMEHKQGHW